MGKVIVSEFISLDGVIEAPQNWHFPFVTDDMMEVVKDDILSSDAFLYGRVTYEEFAPFWPSQTNDELGIAAKLNSAPKYVVSNSLDRADWNNTTVLKGNAAEEVARLKQRQNGSIGLSGSATLIRSLMQADLIDEYRLCQHPIVVGSGRRLFGDGTTTTPLKLVDSKPFSGGVLYLTYQPERK